MTLDRELLAERLATVERHLARVASRLPAAPDALRPMTDAADVVVLHLWQATQIVIDLALALCLRLHLGTPSTYAEAFRLLQRAGHLDTDLADRLVRAAGFRNVIAHEYGELDLQLVHLAASRGPADLRAFLAIAVRLVTA